MPWLGASILDKAACFSKRTAESWKHYSFRFYPVIGPCYQINIISTELCIMGHCYPKEEYVFIKYQNHQEKINNETGFKTLTKIR